MEIEHRAWIFLLASTAIFCGCSTAWKPRNFDRASSKGIRVELDTSAATIVTQYLRGKEELPLDFDRNKGVQLLVSRNQHKDNQLTAQSFKQLLVECRKGTCAETQGVKLATLSRRLDKIGGFLDEIESNREAIRQATAEAVALNIPEVDFHFSYPIYIILGGGTDAYVELIDGEPGMVLDLVSLTQDTEEASWKMLRGGADHELWHAVFLRYVQEHWPINPITNGKGLTDDPDWRLIFTFLNEGYGHYMSIQQFRGTPEKALKFLESKARTSAQDGFFDIFLQVFPHYLASKNPDEKDSLVTQSHTGDMLKKWGAMTGALAIATIDVELGRKQLLDTFRHDPFSIWLTYQRIAKPRYQLPGPFLSLVETLNTKFFKK